MKFNKIIGKLCIGLAMLSGVSFTSCKQGLTYEEAPESAYSDVALAANPFTLRAREWFQGQIYAINWNKWADNYINTQQISWEATLTTESSSDAPDGTLYVINVKANTKATYNTQNKGYLFVGSKFSGNYEFVDSTTTTIGSTTEQTAQKVILPVRQNEVIGELNVSNPYDNVVERIGDAPELGVPADFSKPARYLVKNICYRPAGVPQVTRLYEVRVTFVDKPVEE